MPVGRKPDSAPGTSKFGPATLIYPLERVKIPVINLMSKVRVMLKSRLVDNEKKYFRISDDGK